VPREFGPFFIFAQDQFNDDKHTRDFELRPAVVAPEVPDTPPGGGGDGPDTSQLPDNPPGSVMNSVYLVRPMRVSDTVTH
tara:strand:+ start:215 stop:454 length:240 start_codon:yes stop_codon:yes gene_type:complete